MKRRLALLLALLGPLPAAIAGPPEPPSGRTALDEVADGLRRYRAQGDPERRRDLLAKLAPTGDPRVAVALGEVLASSPSPVAEVVLLSRYYLPADKRGSTDAVWDWWRENEAELRRRAKELP
jgi:hypothetical protein